LNADRAPQLKASVGRTKERNQFGIGKEFNMSVCCCGQNVLDHHGADPTGATDSTEAFLRAIAALGIRGGIVTIPAGRYRIDGAPIRVHTPVSFRGASGMMRTGDWNRVGFQGSITTLVFPSDRDGFVVEPDAVSVGFANLALVRDVPDRNARDFARRGIHAKRPIYVDSLYLVNWERGIDLDGRKDHPDQPQDPAEYNVNGSEVERITAENCFWGTYTQGWDAGNCHFLHVYCLSCNAGIFDSSQAGNGYVNCYVEGLAGDTEPPYYMDNQSVLVNCRCESALPPQLGQSVQAIGGALTVEISQAVKDRLGIPAITGFRYINGVPALIVSEPFANSGFIGGEQIEVTVDEVDGVDGEMRVVTFARADQSPAQVADRINAAFPADLPRVASANGFDSRVRIEGWRGHGSGNVKVTGAPTVLAQIGFPAAAGKSAGAGGVGHLLSQPEILNSIFLGYSGPGGAFGTSQTVQVQVAHRGDVAFLWQSLGADGDEHELSLIRLRDANAGTRRWGFARASAEMLTSLAITMDGDPLGADQVVMYHGVWLQNSSSQPAVLLCNGEPAITQGRPGDIAWDMAAKPPTRYVRGAGGWSAA
jgi:hypothetical protein